MPNRENIQQSKISMLFWDMDIKASKGCCSSPNLGLVSLKGVNLINPQLLCNRSWSGLELFESAYQQGACCWQNYLQTPCFQSPGFCLKLEGWGRVRKKENGPTQPWPAPYLCTGKSNSYSFTWKPETGVCPGVQSLSCCRIRPLLQPLWQAAKKTQHVLAWSCWACPSH